MYTTRRLACIARPEKEKMSMYRNNWQRLLVILASFAASACGGGGGGSGTLVSTQPALTSIALSPLAVSLAPGGTKQLSVIGTYANGSTASLTSGETFQSSNASIASVSSAGVVSVAANAAVGSTALITATDTASGLTTNSAGTAVVTVVTQVTGVPTATSVSAATATAQNNAVCSPLLQPFYWEIGDQNGALASGSLGTDSTTGNPVSAITPLSMASASKWIYSTYVTQVRGSAANLTADDVNFLHFTSGYTNMGNDTNTSTCPSSDDPDTIDTCLLQINSNDGLPFGAQIAANVGIFDYDSGHEEVHASKYSTVGNVLVGSLATTIWATLGTPGPMLYSEPLLAGGLFGSTNSYTAILRAILNGTLAMNGALDLDPVCTNNGGIYTQNPVGVCTAGGSPIPENWHYSIGHWVEDDPAYNNDGSFSSPGAFGYYPWIDSTRTYYGVVAREEHAFSGGVTQQGYASQNCGRLIRRAFVTGVEQTGVIPTN
jgi:hypothetical protein